MSLANALQPLLSELEAMPANQDFDVLVSLAVEMIAKGRPLAAVVGSLINDRQIKEHLAMVIVAAAKAIALAAG